MKHCDINPHEAIDRVLTGLREAEPLEGMQERVMRGARERAAARRRWNLRLPLGITHPWAVAAATIAVIALAASWTLVHRHHAPHEIAHAPVRLPPANAPIVETHLASSHVTLSQPTRGRRSVSAEKSALPIEPVSDEESLAISEMNAPSHPAPPMPLTEQERLLIRLIHKGDPVQMAMLDPGFRSLEEAKSKAEFDRFFAPKATSGSKSSTTLNQPATEESPATANQPATGEKSDPKKQ